MFEKEIFIDMLLREYPEKVEDMIHECQFDGKSFLDIDDLNLRLSEMIQSKFVFMLSENDWLSIIFELVPEKYDQYSYQQVA